MPWLESFDALSVKCPECWAPPGERCRNAPFRPRVKPHGGRVERARDEWQKQNLERRQE